jgi:hypothetical protein
VLEWDLPGAVDICAEFGVSTAAADNSTALNTALSTLGPLGLEAVIPIPGVYVIKEQIVVGNGSGSALATYNPLLRGVGSSPREGLGGFGSPVGVTLQWDGAAGVDGAVVVQGPVAGVSLKHLLIAGQLLARTPLLVIGAQNSRFEDLGMQNCYRGIVCNAAPSVGGYITDCMHNKWSQIGIRWNGKSGDADAAFMAGILLDGDYTDENVCYDEWDDVAMVVPGTSVGNVLTALYLRWCDTVHFNNVQIYATTGGTDQQWGAVLDFNGASAGGPSGCSVDGVDFGGLLVTQIGSPASNAEPTFFTKISKVNAFTPNPNVSKANWDDGAYPQSFIVDATNAAWPIPAGANQLEITAVGGGGGGGGSATTSGGISDQAGGGGGGAGQEVTRIVAVGTNAALAITIGAGGTGGAGGAANDNPGSTGSNGASTTVIGTGVSVTAVAGSAAAFSAANSSATSAGGEYGGAPDNRNTTAYNGGPGAGGVGASFGGFGGGAAVGSSGRGGGAGGAASATLGGVAGSAVFVGAGGSATTAGVAAANAPANSGQGGDGGGGGAPGGAGGAGGAGGSGFVIVRVVG